MPVKQNLVAEQPQKIVDKINYPATALTETLTNGFFTVDNKWTVKYWNKAAEKILRVKAPDIIGKNLWEKFEGIIPVELYAIDQRAFLKDTPVHFHEYWGEMGAWFDVITYHCDDTLSVSFKSSKHPHAEHAGNTADQLKALTELYRFVTEITNDCLWEWNLLSHEIFWIDGGHKRVFGYQVENALIPQNFWENCIHPEDKAAVLFGLKKTITKKSCSLWEATYRFKAADGNYLHVHDRGHIIYDEDGKAIRIIGATQDITQNILLQEKLTKERLIKQHEITDAVLTSQERERETIATELNENLNQLLVAAKWNIQIARTNKDKADSCLDNSVTYLNKVIGETKRIYKSLQIPDKNIFSLSENIKYLIEARDKDFPVKFKFNEGGIDEKEDLTKNMQQDIFRIVQEQVNNIIKHANATHACIDLRKQQNKIILTVSDDGIGNNAISEKKAVGMINIQSRAELYDGTVSITSKPGKGYSLKVVLPCFPDNL